MYPHGDPQRIAVREKEKSVFKTAESYEFTAEEVYLSSAGFFMINFTDSCELSVQFYDIMPYSQKSMGRNMSKG